jgi:hypothetical protein
LGIEATLTADRLTVVGRIPSVGIEARRTLDGPFPPANDAEAMAAAARGAFDKMGDTGLSLASFRWENPAARFVPVSRLNAVRRDLAADLEAALRRAAEECVARIKAEVCPPVPSAAPTASLSFGWSLKVDRVAFLDSFEAEDWAGLEELVVDVARDHPTRLMERLDHWAGILGRERIRLALPPLTRKWEDHGLRLKIEKLRAAGWTKWEAANVSAWPYLGLDPSRKETNGLDLATDWSVYAVNRAAARQLFDMGVTRFALSPEDGLDNIRSLLAEFGPRAVLIVHQDTPLFVAESCAYANLIGGCPGKANCSFESMEMTSSHGERVTAIDYHCRTIVLNRGAFCLSTRLADLAAAGAVSLRADFVYRKYEPTEVRRVWRDVRAGRAIPGGHAANFDRGML